MALRAGPRGLFGGTVEAGGLALRLLPLTGEAARTPLDEAALMLRTDASFSVRPFPSALNNRLRTGADKGNPTV